MVVVSWNRFFLRVAAPLFTFHKKINQISFFIFFPENRNFLQNQGSLVLEENFVMNVTKYLTFVSDEYFFFFFLLEITSLLYK